MSGPDEFRHPTLIDDDERLRHSGSIWTASALMITAVIGSVVLSLAGGVAQLGLVAGPIVILLFSLVTCYTCSLLTYICYRSGDMVTGSNNYTYLDLIQSNLGWKQGKVCGWILNVYFLASAGGCTTAVSKIMMAMTKSICLHASGGHTGPCRGLSSISYMNIVYGIIQIIISQLLRHGFDQQTWYSVTSGVMFLTYSGISIYLCVREVVANGTFKGSLIGRGGMGSITEMNIFWRVFQAIGVIAPAYSSCSMILIETLDRVKSEAQTMKKATLIGITVPTIYYMICGFMGYTAFGDLTPEDLLSTTTSTGRSGSDWLLIHIANAALVIHLMITYQAYCQPIYALVEKPIANRLQSAATNFIIRLVWRPAFVVLTTFVSMLMLPFFEDVVRLVRTLEFCCLVVYSPVEMYISQKKPVKWTLEWVWLRTLSVATLVLSLGVAVAYGHAILVHLKTYKPFWA